MSIQSEDIQPQFHSDKDNEEDEDEDKEELVKVVQEATPSELQNKLINRAQVRCHIYPYYMGHN